MVIWLGTKGVVIIYGWGGGQILSARDFQISTDPPPVNNDHSLIKVNHEITKLQDSGLWEKQSGLRCSFPYHCGIGMQVGGELSNSG